MSKWASEKSFLTFEVIPRVSFHDPSERTQTAFGKKRKNRKREEEEEFGIILGSFSASGGQMGWSDFFDKVVQKACVLSVKVVATCHFAAEWRTWHAKNLLKHMKNARARPGATPLQDPRFAREAARNPQCKHCLGNYICSWHLFISYFLPHSINDFYTCSIYFRYVS